MTTGRFHLAPCPPSSHQRLEVAHGVLDAGGGRKLGCIDRGLGNGQLLEQSKLIGGAAFEEDAFEGAGVDPDGLRWEGGGER